MKPINIKLLNLKLKIRHKLFVAILAANALLVSAIFIFGSWILDTSFRDYLDKTEPTRLSPLADDLTNDYSKQGNWPGLETIQILACTDWPVLTSIKRQIKQGVLLIIVAIDRLLRPKGDPDPITAHYYYETKSTTDYWAST